jgi:hypothetical protein
MTDTLEPQQKPANGEHRLALLGVEYRFSGERASIAGKKGVIARRQRQLERNIALVKAQAEEIAAKEGKPELPAESPDKYTQDRIARTRRHIQGIDRQLEASDDPKEIKSLCDALARLEEIERILSGRPLPGSRRPGRDKPTKSTPASGPIED